MAVWGWWCLEDPEAMQCCGHHEDAHDAYGCLVQGCWCLLDGEGVPVRDVELHDAAGQFRIPVAVLERWIELGSVKARKRNGSRMIASSSLRVIRDRWCKPEVYRG